MAYNPNNHTDSFQPPGKPESVGDPTQAFQAFAGLCLWIISIMSAFWAMLARRPDTIGVKAYFVDVMLCLTLLTALSQNSWYPDRYLFRVSSALLIILYLKHLYATSKSDRHVHSRCVGVSRFGSESTEAIIALLIGLGFCALGAVPYGAFLMFSALALLIKGMMIGERDKKRAKLMMDSVLEQEHMMETFEQYRRERGH